MKHHSTYLGLVILGLAAVSCNKEGIPEPKEGQAFTIYASLPETRTANDGMHTVWTANDQIFLLHVPAGLSDPNEFWNYQADAFILADPATGKFVGKLSTPLKDGEKYDWYAVHNGQPYPPGINPIMSLQVGADTQTQKGETMTHLAGGQSFPIYGKLLAAGNDPYPTIPMKNLAAVMKLVITNQVDNVRSVQVEKIVVTHSAKPLSGSQKINILSDGPDMTHTVMNPGVKDRTVTLNVTSGKFLSKGRSSAFYIGIPPLICNAGESMTFTVSVKYLKQASTQTITKTFDSDFAFHPGEIRTFTMNYTEPLVQK